MSFGFGSGGFGGSTGPFGASSQPAMGQSAAGFGASPSPFGGGQSSVFGQQSQPAFGAGASATMFSVGCSGFFSVKGEVRQGMAVANGLLVATMLGQVGLLLFVFTDNPWKRDLPVDPSGWWVIFSQYVDAHGHLVKLTSIIILMTEFLGLVLSFWLHSIYQTDYEEWLDNLEDRENRARDILGRAAEESYARGAESGWNARTKDRYGIESLKLQENTQAIHQTSLLTTDE